MPLPVLGRLRPRPVLLDKDELLQKAMAVARDPRLEAELPSHEREQVGEVVKAISFGSGYTPPQKFRPQPNKRPAAQSAAVVAARAHSVLGPSSRIMPVDIAVALQQQGMDFVEPFAPGTPLQPFYGYGRRPRTFDYPVGRNISTETRHGRIPYDTLDKLYDAYDVARICTRHAINSMRSMCPPRFEAIDGYDGKNPTKEIAEARKRLRRPDNRQFLPDWLAENMLSLWKFDSAPIFRLRDRAGNVKRLQNVSAKVIAPMLDYYGDLPDAPAPAFQQVIQGVPWNWLTLDDLIYQPFWPETDSPFGTPPLETVLVNANTDVRLQLFFLQFFTAGQVPEAFAIAPENMSTSDDLAEFQEHYDTETSGDQSERYGLKWLPHDTELVFYKPQTFDPELAEYVMRRTVSGFLMTPHNLGFTSDVNRAAGDTQMDVQFRITDLPIVGYYQNLLDAVIQDDWDLPVQLRFDTGRDREDRKIEAEAHQIYVQMGAESIDEVREKVLGYPIDPDEKIGRFIMDERLGVIPLAHVVAISGEVDPLTGAPKPGTVEPQPYQLPGGGNPVPAAGPQGGQPAPAAGARPKANDPTKAYPRPPTSAAKLALPTDVKDDSHSPQPLGSGSPGIGRPGYGVVSQGSPAQGTGAVLDPDAEQRDLRAWRRQSMRRVKAGKLPRFFETRAIDLERQDRIWDKLSGSTTTAQVDAAFKSARPIAAGIVAQAADTGRVLMVQRSFDKHDPEEARARWEFPGGTLDEGEMAFEGALREFGEETGAELTDFRHVGNWSSPDGVYIGFVVEVPREDALSLHPDPHEVTAAQWWDKDSLDRPEVREKVTDTLDRVTPMLKGWEAQPRNAAGQWSTHATLEWSGYHRHTDLIVDHYTPMIEAVMADVQRSQVLRQVIEEAYRHVAKASQPQSPAQRIASRGAAAASTGGVVGGATAAGLAGTIGTAAAGALGAVNATTGVAAALAALALAPRVLDKLRAVLTRLYGDAYLQGAHEAAVASGGEMPPWTRTVEIPQDYFEHWTPGVGEQAAERANGSLAQVLRERDIWIKDMTETQVDRIGEVIARSVRDGRPLSEAIAAVDSIVHDEQRARMIAETEYARASTLARRETYGVNRVPMVKWLHQPDACPQCMANAAVSPIPLGASWPSGGVPVHPWCRCAEAPVVVPRRS